MQFNANKPAKPQANERPNPDDFKDMTSQLQSKTKRTKAIPEPPQ